MRAVSWPSEWLWSCPSMLKKSPGAREATMVNKTEKSGENLKGSMGKLIIDSIHLLDRPVVMAYLMIIVLMFVVINLVLDVLYSILDPRVRLQDVQS